MGIGLGDGPIRDWDGPIGPNRDGLGRKTA